MDAEVLPVEAQATQRNPAWRANEAATVMPVSLKEPVGFIPWCLARTRGTPVMRAHCGISYSGVLPSRSVIACCSFLSAGRSSRKRQTPLRSAGEEESRRCFHLVLSSCVIGAAFSDAQCEY